MMCQGDLSFQTRDFTKKKNSSFIEYHLKPPAQNIKSHIKDMNDFLCKLASLPPLPHEVELCTIE